MTPIDMTAIEQPNATSSSFRMRDNGANEETMAENNNLVKGESSINYEDKQFKA